MDIFTVVGTIYCLYVFIWFLISCIADCDVVTFLSSHFMKSPASEFEGKICWVTGASSGIGEALAKRLALCNARLAISARRKDELARVKQECLGQLTCVNGAKSTGKALNNYITLLTALNPKLKDKDVLVLDFDMVDYSVHESSYQRVVKHFGKLDLLISNAGKFQRARWENTEIEVDRHMFDLNVLSLINLNRIAVRYFAESGNVGALAITSSIAGIIGAPDCGSYTGSKHALHGYFESLRNETRDKNIGITMLCPGPVFSGIETNAFTGKLGEKAKNVNMSRERRMTADRCAYLSLVAIANKLEESWFALFPLIIVTHFLRNHSFLISKIMSLVDVKRITKAVRGTK